MVGTSAGRGDPLIGVLMWWTKKKTQSPEEADAAADAAEVAAAQAAAESLAATSKPVSYTHLTLPTN